MSLICLLIGNLKNVLASSFTPCNIKWIDSWNKSVFEHFSSSANFEKFDEKMSQRIRTANTERK